MNELWNLVDTLKEMPDRGLPAQDGTRRVLLKSYPYQVVYVTEPRLQVIAVAHASRKPGYWRKRL